MRFPINREPNPSSPDDILHRADLSVCSWENGTKAEAILELYYPSYSAYSPTTAFPLPDPLQSQSISDIISIAEITLQNRPPTNTSAKGGGSPLLNDGAAGDPASLGVSVLLANASMGNTPVKGVGYGDAATGQLNYLLYDVPRVSVLYFSRIGDGNYGVTCRVHKEQYPIESTKFNFGPISYTWSVHLLHHRFGAYRYSDRALPLSPTTAHSPTTKPYFK